MILKKNLLISLLMLLFFISTSANDIPRWLRYPSISPDGSTILFCYKGDIYKVSADGGNATPLTINPAYDYKPIWSPDGKYIAFASNRFGSFDIFVMNAEGGKAERLTYFSKNEIPTSFSPDGKNILFSAEIMDITTNVFFPNKRVFDELYYVPKDGGRIKQILSTPAQLAIFDNKQENIIYQDVKGTESYWRKHHTSSVTKDIWVYNINTELHTKLTDFEGEDRNPVFNNDETEIFFLREGLEQSFNVYKFPVSNPKDVLQITNHEKHPVRFLTISKDNTLCYSYNGDVYIKKNNEESKKIEISISMDLIYDTKEYKKMTSGASQINISPDGKEVVFVVRGEIFVTSTEYSTTKRITNTPEEERNPSFSPDGRTILYASERNGSWNIYETSIISENEKNFTNSTLLEEKIIINTDNNEFQPEYSPDSKKIAYLENRTTLKVFDKETKTTKTILDGKYNYSYKDGDIKYGYSPDGKWFLVQYSPHHLFMSDIALVDAQGNQNITNLTKSGFKDRTPKWMLGGKMLIWFSDRDGLNNLGSTGKQWDVFGLFLTKEAYDDFNLTEEEFATKYENIEKENPENKDIKIEFDGIRDRMVRLTINSSSMSDAVMSADGEKLFYLTKFEKDYDLWVHEFRENNTKLIANLSGYGKSLKMDKDGNNLFLLSGGKILKISTKNYKKTTISYQAEMYLDKSKEREYMFYHVWNLIKVKHLDINLHGTDWDFYKKEYEQFLPHINNNYDFAEMLSEMLGELNSSHTGSGYIHKIPYGDETARFAAFFDPDFDADGLKIIEIIKKGPLTKANSKIKEGIIIEKIDGITILKDKDYYQYLNHKAGKNVLLSLYNPETSERWQEIIKPITIDEEKNLLYDRWIENRKKETEKLSDGRIGYIHIKGMNDQSFRDIYSEILGENYDKEAIIIDTRFNTGGWLHDQLVTFLSGKKYINFAPRGVDMGYEPKTKWVKPSILLINEANYSDAHAFPYAYRELEIGKTVGMPIPGTMTAVWWETLVDKSLYFGIPQIAVTDMDGNILENTQFEPDYKVRNQYNVMVKNRDQQLEKAVEVLMQELK